MPTTAGSPDVGDADLYGRYLSATLLHLPNPTPSETLDLLAQLLEAQEHRGLEETTLGSIAIIMLKAPTRQCVERLRGHLGELPSLAHASLHTHGPPPEDNGSKETHTRESSSPPFRRSVRARTKTRAQPPLDDVDPDMSEETSSLSDLSLGEKGKGRATSVYTISDSDSKGDDDKYFDSEDSMLVNNRRVQVKYESDDDAVHVPKHAPHLSDEVEQEPCAPSEELGIQVGWGSSDGENDDEGNEGDADEDDEATRSYGSPFIRSLTARPWPNISRSDKRFHEVESWQKFPEIVICPTAHKRESQLMVEKVLLLAAEYITGRSQWYPPIFQVTKASTKAHGRWVDGNLKTIQVSNQRYPVLQSIADEFSKHFSIQRMHATTFRDQIVLPHHSSERRSRYKRAMREIGYTPATYTRMATCLLHLCDIARDPSEYVHPDLVWSIAHLRSGEWMSLINILLSQEVNLVHTGIQLRAKTMEALRKIKLSAQRHAIFHDWFNRRHSSLTYSMRTAGGARYIGGGLYTHLNATRCLPRACIPERVANTGRLDTDWVEVPLIHDQQRPTVKQEAEAGQSDDQRSWETALLCSRVYKRDDCSIRLKGQAASGWTPTWETLQDAIALMTPRTRTLPGEFFQTVRPRELRYRHREHEAEVEFCFADPAHATIAWHRIHKWRTCLGLTNAKPVYNPANFGQYHPLSELTTICIHGVSKLDQLVGMAGWGQLPEVPESARIARMTDDDWKIKVFYNSPIAARRMLEQTYPIRGTGKDPYTSTLMTGPLHLRHAVGFPLCCLRCGRFGHDRHQCLEEDVPSIPVAECRSCWFASLPQTHSTLGRCPIATSFRHNAKALLQATTRRLSVLSIFGTEVEWFDDFFAEAGPDIRLGPIAKARRNEPPIAATSSSNTASTSQQTL